MNCQKNYEKKPNKTDFIWHSFHNIWGGLFWFFCLVGWLVLVFSFVRVFWFSFFVLENRYCIMRWCDFLSSKWNIQICCAGASNHMTDASSVWAGSSEGMRWIFCAWLSREHLGCREMVGYESPPPSPLLEIFCMWIGSDFSSCLPPGLVLWNRVPVLSGFCFRRRSIFDSIYNPSFDPGDFQPQSWVANVGKWCAIVLRLAHDQSAMGRGMRYQCTQRWWHFLML